MSSRSSNVDRLSLLPDELLAHILSLMPTNSAVSTSILSKRWRSCWTLIHSFDFHPIHHIHGSPTPTFSNSVDRVMKLCKATHIKSFRLHFPEFLVQNSHITKWIHEAVRLNVCELDLQVIMSELPLSLFTCKTLTKLRLVDGGYNSNGLRVPPGVIFPCLKTLDINVFREPFVNVSRLIHGCPVLESLRLSLDTRTIRGEDNQEYNLNVPTLKRFELQTPRSLSDIKKVVLNVPNLKYLILGGILCSIFVMEDLSSLVEANVSYSQVEYKHLMIELLKGLTGVKSLSWSTSTIGVPLDSPLPEFVNLKHLEFKGFSFYGWLLMFKVLQCSSKLEHLCIEGAEEFCWTEPNSVPSCMLSNLRSVKFINFKRRKCDIKFVEYLLANAKVLKRLTITSNIWPPAYEMRFYEQLLKFPCASGCEIHFIPKWCDSISN